MRHNMIVIIRIMVFLILCNLLLGGGLLWKSRKEIIIPKSTSTYWALPGLALGNVTCPAFRSPLYGAESCFTETPGQYPLQPIQWVGDTPSSATRARIKIEEVL